MKLPTFRLFEAITKLAEHLAIEDFHANCNCLSCDKLRRVHEAREEIKAAYTEMLGEGAPTPSEAQTSAEAVAQRPWVLARKAHLN